MFPMLESSAVKASVKENRIQKKVENNPEVEELHNKCYEDLMEALTILAEKFNLKTSSIITIQASEVTVNSTCQHRIVL